MPLLKRSLLLALLVTLCAAVAVADETFTDEELQTLVDQLGARRYKARVAATRRLIEIGLPAKRVLLKNFDHEELEIRARVRIIIRKLGIMNPIQMREVEKKLPLVFSDKMFRLAAAKQILALGADAKARLQRELLREIDDVKITVTPPGRWVTIDELRSRKWRIRIKNVSKRPLLLPRFSRHRIGREGWDLIPSRTGGPAQSHHSGKLELLTGKEEPATLANADAMKPGDVRSWFLHAPQPPGVGRWHMFLRIQPEARTKLGKHELKIGLFDKGKPGTVLTKDLGYELYAFPDWSDAVKVNGVGLTIEASGKADAGGKLTARLTLTNTSKKAARIDANWDRYTWVALARDGGDVVIVRVAREVRVPAEKGTPPKKRQKKSLEAGKSLTAKIVLKVPGKPGTYRLAAALEGARDDEDEDDEDGVDSYGYLADRVLAKALEIDVTEKKK